ncbi:MAG: DUF4880 domain-containing protein [Alphaproteobacteria bacterium]|nr:DUF4880 domain-containing protein [Alphaproteobacteria bacterium]
MTQRPDEIDDRIWEAAFDWLAEIERRPEDAELDAAFRAWLAESGAHADAYAQVRRIWSAAPHMPPAFGEQWRHLPAPGAAPPLAPRRPAVLSRRQWLAGGGALAAGLALYAATGGFRDLTADHATGTGETRTVALPDGSRMQLDTDTALRVTYEADRRNVALLRGRAYFDVRRDAARPFAVAAGPARIEVLGTRFDVRLDGAAVDVAVEQGRVAVRMAGRDVGPRDGLGRGEAVRIDRRTRAVRRETPAPDTIAAWRRGQLVVDGWTIAEVLDELGRYHRGVILLRDEALGAQRVSGFYDLARPAEAVRSVAQSHGGRVTQVGPWLLVVSGR